MNYFDNESRNAWKSYIYAITPEDWDNLKDGTHPLSYANLRVLFGSLEYDYRYSEINSVCGVFHSLSESGFLISEFLRANYENNKRTLNNLSYVPFKDLINGSYNQRMELASFIGIVDFYCFFNTKIQEFLSPLTHYHGEFQEINIVGVDLPLFVEDQSIDQEQKVQIFKEVVSYINKEDWELITHGTCLPPGDLRLKHIIPCEHESLFNDLSLVAKFHGKYANMAKVLEFSTLDCKHGYNAEQNKAFRDIYNWSLINLADLHPKGEFTQELYVAFVDLFEQEFLKDYRAKQSDLLVLS